jgi:8-oxo-dGTP pyrophosphatase MutT (NUDIX family)
VAEKRRVVGLLVMTEMPDGILYAVLQRRGEFNHEKMGPESFPGGCQVTAWGGMKEGETPAKAMLREVKEELGEMICRRIIRRFGFLPSKLLEIYRFKDEKNLKVVYGVKLPCKLLEEIRLGPQSGGLRLLKEEEIPLIQDLKSFDRNIGVTDRRIIAMFSDTKEAIQNAFKLFSR